MLQRYVRTGAMLLGLAFLIASTTGRPVQAQESSAVFPRKAVRFIVPFPPGGPTDVLARAFGQKLSELWGQPVVIDNKPGAGGIIGIDAAAKAEPDGHTFAMAASAFLINPSLYPKLPFDTLNDLTGVTQLVLANLVLATNPSLPVNTVPELIALAKSRPGALKFASPGSGTSAHLAGEMLKAAAGIDMIHVPYKGTSPAQVDLLGGRVDMIFDVLPTEYPLIKAGKLKAIAVAGTRPDPLLPNSPTIAETLPGFYADTMFGVVTAAATPRDLVHRLYVDFAKVLGTPEMKEKIASLGLQPVGSTPEEFNAYIRAEIKKWAEVVKTAHARPD